MGKGRQIAATIFNYFCRGKTKVGTTVLAGRAQQCSGMVAAALAGQAQQCSALLQQPLQPCWLLQSTASSKRHVTHDRIACAYPVHLNAQCSHMQQIVLLKCSLLL